MPAVTIYISEEELKELKSLAKLLNDKNEKTKRGIKFTPTSVASKILRVALQREKKK